MKIKNQKRLCVSLSLMINDRSIGTKKGTRSKVETRIMIVYQTYCDRGMVRFDGYVLVITISESRLDDDTLRSLN